MSSKAAQKRAAELRELVAHHLYRYHVLDDPEISDVEFDRLFDELRQLEDENPDLAVPDSPTQRVGAPPSERFHKVEHLTPMGSLEKVTTEETLTKWVRGRPQAARLRRAGRVRHGAEDRRLRDLARLRGRPARSRGDARGRGAR